MSVSVALCTHNGVAFIEEQLRSVLDQSLSPGEIVVSDDASTDATVSVVEAVVESWRRAHSDRPLRLRILRNSTPLGVTANFDQALAACTGDLIALCDQDDLWHLDRLERMKAEFDRRPALRLLHTDARLVDETGVATGQTLLATLAVSDGDRRAVHDGHAMDALLRRNIVTGATTLVRRELLDSAHPFPTEWVHDEWLAIVAAATGEVDFLEEPLIDYRQHGGNQIGASSLDISGKFARLRAPRTARNLRLLRRTEVLAQRAAGFRPAASTQTLAKIDAKRRHERMRAALPAVRIRRIIPVARAWRAGNYDRFGLGLQDVLRDLVQPA
jgi:glycosyltransferase involved in cell wall biosynthesis